MKLSLLLPLLLLAACVFERGPGVDQAPEEMSAQTLCFDYANSQDPKLGAEILARNIDCAGLLREDPLYRRGPDRDTADRIGR